MKKKTYKKPSSKVLKIDDTSPICASASFGEGTTDIMHAKQRGTVSDEEDDLWFE